MLYEGTDQRYPLCFIHIPKTGGRSIAHYVRSNKLDVALNGHNRRLMRPNQQHYNFTVVRHPYTRYVSAINYALATKEAQEALVRALFTSFNYIMTLDLVDIFSEGFIQNMNIFGRQSDFTKHITLDKIYKYEDGLEQITLDLQNTLGFVEVDPLKRINVSSVTYTVGMLTRRHKDALNQWYAEDFSLFNYTQE